MDGTTCGSRRRLAGRYELDRVVGHGAMGTVWAARDDLLGREVAVALAPVAVHDHGNGGGGRPAVPAPVVQEHDRVRLARPGERRLCDLLRRCRSR